MSINTKTGRRNVALRDAVVDELAAVLGDCYGPSAIGMHTALEDVLFYMDECERVGVSMHPADVRSLIATALGVAS